MNRIAVFLDRDGTINEDPGYLHDPNQLRLYPDAASSIAMLNQCGLIVVLVTNQGGIARGYYTEKDFIEVQERMAQMLSEAGAHLDAVYHCPHHPDGTVEEYRVVCQCRKPAPGMLRKAAADLGIDLTRSYMVGDKTTDVQAGAAAGCKTVWIAPPEAGGKIQGAQPNHIADSLSSAVPWILKDLAYGR